MTLQELFIKYKGEATTLIETGTYNGSGIVAALNSGFEKVYSFEIDKDLATAAQKKFKDNPNVTIINESSCGQEFKRLCVALTHSCVFWLDAHKMGTGGQIPDDYPLSAELEGISFSTCYHTVLIDDVRLFGRYGVDIGKFNRDGYKLTYETIRAAYNNDVLCLTPEVEKCEKQ
jgi:hypothetical protein